MLRFRKQLPEYSLGGLIIAASLVWAAIFYLQDRDYLTVAFLDIGQGDAIFIEAPNGNQVLIDGGPNQKVLSELSKVMPFYDRSIDVVIATHPDADHIGGLPEVLARYDIDYVFDSASASDTGVYKEWTSSVEKENARYTHVFRGTRILLGENVRLDILYPFPGQISEDANNMSVVAKLIYGKTCFILTGDLERVGEFKLLDDDISCEVLKIGHHGSKTSTSDAFLAAIAPKFAVIQSGEDNKYGHPNGIVLNKLQAADIAALRNDELGLIKIRSDGERVWLDK